MILKKEVRLIVIVAFISIFFNTDLKAQWGAPYTNSWISYSKPYVKISVTQKGLHRLPFSILPKDFPISQPEKIQLWHRGQQVAIVSLANSEILFYGVPNDGAIDSLLYRPMSSRMNPYWSMYSDESSYFLTVGDGTGIRSELVEKQLDSNVPLLEYQRASIVNAYKDQYSLSTREYLRPDFFNSFFEIGASRTGKYVGDDVATNYPFKLTNLVRSSGAKIIVKLMIHGRSGDNRTVDVSVGKNEQSLRFVNVMSSTGFAGSDYTFELNLSDIDDANNGILSLKSHSNNSQIDRYSLAYYSVTYPQSFDVGGKPSYELGLESTSDAWSRISITNPPVNPTVLDVSDVDKPRLIKGQVSNLMISRKKGSSLNLLVSNETILVKAESLKTINFSSKYLTSANYIIVTSENLLESANQYANYRASAEGGNYKTLVVNIKDLYNQFNFGEPSPVAIRRFADYMLSDASKDKYLYLIGKSITFNERMIRELPDEVPTIGFPGSDILLVEGLAGASKDVPAIPVGRLSAVTNQNVLDYLQKVKEYEHNTVEGYGWRKNVLHLNGGKSAAEITQLKSFLEGIAPSVSSGLVGGKVTPFVKQQGMLEVESVNITPEVNAGVGLMTYFGHGSVDITDLNFGYATDVDRGYNNSLMYPMMYFNGCGVGNIFAARFNQNPGTSDRIALSLDWLIAPKRGAVVIIANSFESYVEPSGRYLDQLYKYMFTDSLMAALPIGKIQLAVAKKIVTDIPSTFNIANVHQSILQGDPVVKLISVPNADYAIDADEGIRIYSETTDKTIGQSEKLNVKVYLQNLGRNVKGVKVPVEVIYTSSSGVTSSKISVTGFAYNDTLSLSIPNEKNLSKIEVKIDSENSLTEITKSNNYAELLVDWKVAEKQSFYPQGVVKDIVPPLLKVTFNGRVIKNDEKVDKNPKIKFILEDDRILSNDTTHVEVFVKPCADNTCEFSRVSYSGKNNLRVTSLSNHAIEIDYDSVLDTSGIYELLVSSKDNAGNVASSSYRIRFQINDEIENFKVVASPNPASSFVRFETSVKGSSALELIEWMIYDLNGSVVDRGEVKPPFSQINEWYWQPKNFITGFYFYRINFKLTDMDVQKVSGKLILIR